MADRVSVLQPRWSVAPYFVVADVIATASFYRDKLGFAYERFWGEPLVFCRRTMLPSTVKVMKMDGNGGHDPWRCWEIAPVDENLKRKPRTNTSFRKQA